MARAKTIDVFFRCKGLCDGAKTLAEMAQALRDAAASLDEMAADGVTLEQEVEDDYPQLSLKTADPALLKKYSGEEV